MLPAAKTNQTPEMQAVTTAPTLRLEIPLIDEDGQYIGRYSPCQAIQGYHFNGVAHPKMIPGLDATFCRCEDCADEKIRGVFWVDLNLRKRLLGLNRWKGISSEGVISKSIPIQLARVGCRNQKR